MNKFTKKRVMDFFSTFFRLKIIACVALFASLIFMQGCASTQVEKDDEKQAESVFFNNENQARDIFEKYTIVPGDVLDVLYHISSWDDKSGFKLDVDYVLTVKFPSAPELNETQSVRPDGTISLPFLGSVYVLGKTVKELTDDLKEKYARILQIPDVYVLVPDFRTRIKDLKEDLRTAPRGLSRLTTVRPDGFTTFPLVGDVFVVRQTLPEVNKKLNDMYNKKLPGLQVDLFLEKNAGYLVYIIGDVKNPGAFPLMKPQTVVECLSLAGGYQYSASLSSVYVLRKHKDKIYSMKVDVKDILKSKTTKLKEIVFIMPDDVIYVPKRAITSIAEVARELSDITFFRGWSLGFGWQMYNAPTSTISTTTTTTTPTSVP